MKNKVEDSISNTKEEPNFARRQAAEEAERLRQLGWTEERINSALGTWR